MKFSSLSKISYLVCFLLLFFTLRFSTIKGRLADFLRKKSFSDENVCHEKLTDF